MKQIATTSLSNDYCSCNYHTYETTHARVYARAIALVRLEFRFNCKRDLNVSYLFPTFKFLNIQASIQKANKHERFVSVF